MPTRVRCITLHQPWASLMACGAKHLETRPWRTKIRGEVYIHASQSKKTLATLRHAPLAQIEAVEKALGLKMGRWATDLPYGQLIARGTLHDCIPAADALTAFPDQRPFGEFTAGRFAHAYKDITPISPIPWKGAQGFFFAEIPSPPPAGELRIYVCGIKQFCPFDISAFNRTMAAHEASGKPFRTWMLEHALSSATGNVLKDGKPFHLANLEWLPRNPETGGTSPYRPSPISITYNCSLTENQ